MPVLDPTFNVVVSEFAPARFFVTDQQYADFDAMRRDYLQRGFISVNVDFSDGTIFGAASVNWQFRAWHDMAHLAVNAPFTADGERAAAAYQVQQVRARYGDTPDARRWAAIIDAEVNGQVQYYLQHGEFVSNQYEFAREYLQRIHGLNLPVDGRGWRAGFAIARIQERRAAEIAPARLGDHRAAALDCVSRIDIPAAAAHVQDGGAIIRQFPHISGAVPAPSAHLGAVHA